MAELLVDGSNAIAVPEPRGDVTSQAAGIEPLVDGAFVVVLLELFDWCLVPVGCSKNVLLLFVVIIHGVVNQSAEPNQGLELLFVVCFDLLSGLELVAGRCLVELDM
ncbi:hypothetical protein Droror1_Dr00003855 [Drosera rotundifolia]